MSRTPSPSRLRLLCARVAAPLACAILMACGGVAEEGTGNQPDVASVGLLQGLSDTRITVNGVGYERAGATVTDGFGQPLPVENLRLGMWLEVQGRVDDGGTTGVARSIRVRPAARGVVTAGGGASDAVTLFGSTVRLGNGTVFDGVPDATALAPGDVVEVHGPLSSAAGDVNASRIEKIDTALPAPPVFELRGRISQLDPIAKTLVVGRRAVSYAGATVTVRSALAGGQVVRVSAGTAPTTDAPWAVEKLTSDQVLPDSLGFLYTEGFVDELAGGPLFQLEDLPVDASAANGKAAITANGLRVAVVGALAKGTLKAKTVAVIKPGEPVVFNLSGAVTDFVSPAAFKLRGVAIDAAGATFVAPATPAALANGVKLLVKGTMSGRTLVAGQVSLIP